MLVMESDRGSKNLASMIGDARRDSGLDDAIKLAAALGAFDPTVIARVTTAVGLFLGVLQTMLQHDGDDHVATVHDFYLAAQDWGIGRHPRQRLKRWSDACLAYEIRVTDI